MRVLPSAGPTVTFEGGHALATGDGFTLLPNSLRLAMGSDGKPDFRFDYIRRDDRSAAIYGMLSFRVEPSFPAQEAVAAFRAAHAGAMIHPLAFTGGFLRLVPLSPIDPPAEMLLPQQLLWNDLGRARFRLQLEEDTAQLVGGLLDNGTLSLRAYAEMEYAVQAAPLPLTAEFDPAELVAALAPPEGDRLVGLDDLAIHLRDRHALLPIRWQGDPQSCPPDRLAASLAALIRLRLGSPVPAPSLDGQGYIRLPASVAPGRMSWNLMQHCESRQVLCLSLNPFAALYQLGDAPRVNRVTVPRMSLGRWTVTINADLPEGTTAELGVMLTAPAHPPHRPSAVFTPLIPLKPPAYSATVTLRFSPAESSPVYTFTTYALLPDGVVTDGVAHPCLLNPARLILDAEDFPATFVTVEVDAALGGGAIITGAAVWAAGRQDFSLDDDRVVTLCLPKEAAEGTLTVVAAPRDGVGRSVTLSLPLRSARLDPGSLPGYGRHQQTVRCTFPAGFRGALLLEVAGEDAEASTALRLTPAEPLAVFAWYAASAFRAGYRFRRRGETAWSPAQPPSVPLQLTIDPVTGAVAIDPRESE